MSRVDIPFTAPPYLQRCQTLTPIHGPYQRLEYLLRLGLGSTSVDIVACHAINSPHQDAGFEQEFQDSVIVDSFIAAQDLDTPNTIDGIVAHGGRFQLRDHSIVFPTGNIRLPENPHFVNGIPVYEFVHCRVATGRSLVVDREDIRSISQFPRGYTSIKVLDVERPDEGTDPMDYYHEFVMGDERRVYPDFVLHFTFDGDADRRKKTPVCEQCDRVAATVYCVADNAKLCDACNVQIHEASNVLRKHKRVPLAEKEAQVVMTLCKSHPSMPVQYFDTELHVPVCAHCRLVGSHSSGENAMHPLVSIEEAYSRSMDALDRERASVDQKRVTIMQQLNQVQTKLEGVHSNAKAVEQRIKAIVEQLLAALQDATQARMSLLLSDESELRRQLQFFDWAECFLNYERTVCDPVEFLYAFKNHSNLLRSCPSEVVHDGPDAAGDIFLDGSLTLGRGAPPR